MLRTPHDAVLVGEELTSGNEVWRYLLMDGWRGNRPDAELSLHDALDNVGTALMNILVRLFERMRAIDPSFGLWRQIKFLRNGWLGGSAGFKVVYFDPDSVRSALDSLLTNTAGHKVARDKLIGSLDHQYDPSEETLPRAELNELLEDGDDEPPPDVDTWREVDQPKEESVHFCVDKQDLRASLRTSSYSSKDAIRHESSDDIHRELMKEDATWNTDFDALDKEWPEKKWGLALEGKPGWEKAGPYYERAKTLLDSLRSSVLYAVRL